LFVEAESTRSCGGIEAFFARRALLAKTPARNHCCLISFLVGVRLLLVAIPGLFINQVIGKLLR
jgi:hypothetical protein